MTDARHTRRHAPSGFVLATALAVSGVVVALSAALAADWRPGPAEAAYGPCGTTHDALDAQELEFLQLLQNWRASQGLQPSNLETSGALNAAAAWFAQHLVEQGPAGFDGHLDHYGRRWQQRAQDCGYAGAYSPLVYGSGEGTGYVSGSSPMQVGPNEGLALVTYQGSGVYIHTPAGFSNPAKCVGVGRFQSADGRTHAWIVVIAQYPSNQPCPASSASAPPTATPTVSPSPTATNSPTPTSTPAATATPTQTPPAAQWWSYAPALAANVNHD